MIIKKSISFILVCSVIISCCAVLLTVNAAENPDLLAGDANRDGIISIGDATSIQRYLVGKEQFDDLTLCVAKTDYNNDALTVNDAALIQRFIAKFDDNLSREVGQKAYIWKSNKYVSALSEYQTYLDRLMSRYIDGGSAVVYRNDHILCQSAKGKANTANDKDIDVNTLFPIGSISKTFCAEAVTLLNEQGKLSIDDKVAKYFPEYEKAKNVSLKNLLTHRSGIRDYVNSDNSYIGHEYPVDEYEILENNTDEQNRQNLLDWLFAQDMKFSPDTQFSYSNSNYYLLALVVEQVSGVSYSEFVRRNIFEPLGMTNSGFVNEMLDSPELCEHTITSDSPYYGGMSYDDYPYALHWLTLHSAGAGDIVSNAEDLNKWMYSLNDGALLSKESLDLIKTNYSGTEFHGLNYGFGICVGEDGGFYHNGDILSFESVYICYPEENIHIFMTTNNVQYTYSKNYNMKQLAKLMANKVRQ